MAGAPKYRCQRVDLVRTGGRPGEFGCSVSAIRNRDHQADRDESRREDGLTTAAREELHEQGVAA